MTAYTVIKYPDAALRKKAAKVEVITDETLAILERMEETMVLCGGIGLAANQVGILQRLIVIKLPGKESIHLINPEITSKGTETLVSQEGCLSFPDTYDLVTRPSSVEIKYTDRDGKDVELSAEGLLATCIQHEMDHLEGKVFIDHLSKVKRSIISSRFRR